MSPVVGLLVIILVTPTARQTPGSGQAQPAAPARLAEDDSVEVRDNGQTIRGRIATLDSDGLTLRAGDTRIALPMKSVTAIDRIGDPLGDGIAIGAGLGGGAALAAMAKVCANTNCSDTSSSLDPRLALLGAGIGAGVGAVLDAAFQRRNPVYRAGGEQPVFVPTAAPAAPSRAAVSGFLRIGWGNVSDDEGSIGDGPAFGGGVLISFRDRIGLQLAYDRHTRRRQFEYGGGFFGTEHLLTAKALISFRRGEKVRPFVSLGAGVIDSSRRSEFPTYLSGPSGPVRGRTDVLHYQSRDRAIGVGTGLNVRLTRRLSVLTDLTLDISKREALASTRLTAGAGWRFSRH